MSNPAVAAILADAKHEIAALPSIEARFQVHRDLMLMHGAEAERLMGEMERRQAAAVDAWETAREIRKSERRGRP